MTISMPDLRATSAQPPNAFETGRVWWALLAVPLFLGPVACGDDDEDSIPTVPATTTSCVDCHTDQERLMATADPDDEPHNEDPGEG